MLVTGYRRYPTEVILDVEVFLAVSSLPGGLPRRESAAHIMST
jgi:hypothetical protein